MSCYTVGTREIQAATVAGAGRTGIGWRLALSATGAGLAIRGRQAKRTIRRGWCILTKVELAS